MGIEEIRAIASGLRRGIVCAGIDMSGEVKLPMVLFLAVALCQTACGPTGIQPRQQNGIVGKWRSADGSYVVEFLPTGACSARLVMRGRVVGGPCTYQADKETITIHYVGIDTHPQSRQPVASATWQYTLNGDTLNVTVEMFSLALQRVH
jgi:hypothetical protein